MGRKKDAEAKEEKPKEEEKAKEVQEEDSPIVKTLKELDDKYLAIEREYEAAVRKLQIEFEKRQKPILDQRLEILTKSDDSNDSTTGTPALPGFWKTALSNCLDDVIQEWDLPVLEYLTNVTKAHLKEDDAHAGFKLSFHFAENPYFSNDELWKEFYTAEDSPWTGEIEVKEIKCAEISWKPGKDVTIEKVAKKVKGGGAKKAKQKKEKEEPRDSFFRQMFQPLKEGMAVDDLFGLDIPMDCDPDEIDEDEMVEYMMGSAHQSGSEIRDSVIPYAVRWYTGECKADSDDDDDEDDEEEDSDDDEEDDEEDDDDDDNSDDEPAKGKGKGRGAGGKKAAPKKSPKTGPDADPGKAAKTEECKQQ